MADRTYPKNIYEVTNTETGETFTGTCQEIADELGTSRQQVYHIALTATVYRKKYTIEPVEKEKLKCKEGIPNSLWEVWDQVTRPFKELSRKSALER